MTAFRIAEYLSPDAIDAALAATYDRTERDGQARTADGYCPLGIALRLACPDISGAPNSTTVAYALMPEEFANYGLHTERWLRIRSAARTFAEYWDTGEITDLAAALGREVTA